MSDQQALLSNTNNSKHDDTSSLQQCNKDHDDVIDEVSSCITWLPSTVSSLEECVRYEINTIEQKLQDLFQVNDDTNNNLQQRKQQQQLQEELEDALDDGFMCIDLQVVQRKLRIWHQLFSFPNNNGLENKAVTPYYAIKCNPDQQIIHWLAKADANYSDMSLPLGYDCASMAELTLAQEQLPVLFPPTHQLKVSSVQTSVSPNTRIIYANPQRAEADLMHSIELLATRSDHAISSDPSLSSSRVSPPPQDLWLTLDGVEEVHKIVKAREKFLTDPSYQHLTIPKLQLIFRIWVPDGHSQVPLGEKFGMALEDIPTIVQACHDLDVLSNIVGVSFHCGSGCESIETYQTALQMAQQAINMIDNLCNQHLPSPSPPHKCWLLDMGGGFPGFDGKGGDEGRFTGQIHTDDDNVAGINNVTSDGGTIVSTTTTTTTTTSMIAASIEHTVRSLMYDQKLTLIAEPGRYFVEASAFLASRIYCKKIEVSNESDSSGGRHVRIYKIPHGVQGVFKDAILCGETFVPKPLRMTNHNGTGNSDDDFSTLFPSKIVGPSGEENDVVCPHCMLPDLQVQDWLLFDRMGAYTMSIASRAGRPVMRYVCAEGLRNDSIVNYY
ncbi:ornithine decarboxylase [Nitzschia inconspicua]|uniref:Ornithine decarboxylase n=1 Tax=Nitzschia inconspicua TaxID=303405 RepID=A0A9K3PXQ3_9STRA|nr:ornithine decarboxylase [Nitzschia inconspicua]